PRSIEPLRTFLLGRIGEGLVPGATFALGRGDGTMHVEALGRRALLPRPEAMTPRTIFDLASLTKPMVTAPLLVELAREGSVDLDDPLESHLEETARTKVGTLTLRSLLTHVSGLPAMNPMEDYRGTKPALYAAIAREPLEAEPGRRMIYSDVGYMLAQGVIERVTGKALDRLARERIFAPLGDRDTRFGILAKDRPRTAPTDRLQGNRGPWLRGRVHDPRARSKALGGVAGNAGVFGTAEETARFCMLMLREGRFGRRRVLSSETVRLMTTNQCPPTVEARRGLGFDIDSPYSAPRGSLFSSESYGHSGYTGTSMWIDPRNDAFFVLLTNSLHAGGHKDLKAFRSGAGTLAAVALGIEASDL
ncbi:MAG TPA: serine hydrolase domain-containing protein, partial [Candidatus Polarisedimenticolia bacterium]|nr:serine hydrolase domain-containing protein [Candidatus Polarisedimenticolia bacterium]